MARTGTINAQPLTPLQPIVSVAQPSCIVATGTLSVASSLIGLTFSNDGINYNNTTGIFNGIPAGGSYSITAKNVSGCVSATTTGTVNVQPITPTAPIVGTLTQPSCALATGSVILSGLPAGSWTINPGAINGSTSTTNISALVSGGHLFTVTNSMGCTSVSSANVQINVQPVTPLAPVALAANGLMGNRFTANWNAVSGAIAYAIDVSLNNTFTSFVAGYNNLVVGANLTSIISGLSNGTIYYYRVRASNATCTSVNSNVITANTLGLPTLTTSVISSITFNTASSGGNIISDGGSSVTARGICWNTIGTPTIADNIISNATGIGAFSSNLSGLTAGTTYFVRAYATNSVGTSYGNQISFNTPSGVGIIVSNNNDAGAGSLRYALSNVTSGGTITFTSGIDGQTINLLTGTLTIDKNVILDNSNHITGITVSGSSDNIIINAGRTLTLASGSKLTITGAIRNNAGASGFIISSGASFIQNNVDLPATAQRVLNNGWHLFGSPFKKSMSAMLSSITPTGSSTQLLPYANGTGWGANVTSSVYFLLPTTGYAIRPVVSFTATLSGNLFYSPIIFDYTSSLIYNGTTSSQSWNLMANPYTSYINWNLLGKTNISTSLYLWDNSLSLTAPTTNIANFRTYNSMTGIGVPAGTLPYIAPMQGFFVKATYIAPKLTFPPTARTHSSASFYKEASNTEILLRLKTETELGNDELAICKNTDAKKSFEGFDSEKMFNDLPIEMYTQSSTGEKLIINTIDKTNVVIPVGINIANGSKAKIIAFGLESNEQVYLEDRFKGKLISLYENTAYEFDFSSEAIIGRFFIRFGDINSPLNNSDVKVFENNDQLNIIAQTGEELQQIEVYSLTGACVFKSDISGSNVFNAKLNLSSAMYLVRVKTSISTQNVKVNWK